MRPFVLCLIAIGLLGGCQKGGAPHEVAPASVAPDAKLAAGPLGTYQRTCGYCHGANVGPVLLGRGLPAETVMFVARNGQGAMPAFRPTEISDAELAALADWIAKSAPNPSDQGK